MQAAECQKSAVEISIAHFVLSGKLGDSVVLRDSMQLLVAAAENFPNFGVVVPEMAVELVEAYVKED